MKVTDRPCQFRKFCEVDESKPDLYCAHCFKPWSPPKAEDTQPMEIPSGWGGLLSTHPVWGPLVGGAGVFKIPVSTQSRTPKGVPATATWHPDAFAPGGGYWAWTDSAGATHVVADGPPLTP